ncbi:hypothetical protein MesoLj131c_63930 [Mesorhizobium sp. 131-3-5]|uniref:hypothetical protein n=1 Tax=Mesorhizobium sp. 131-3-5 TaxID=2744520 RepID=UPI001926E2E3|nr:hypothetical protein [Mesorhizobium sp. 131-3-5]BCH12135.1 hypothetical protein MesoLj131c_63930 [Mesorhizobium sp. 131-3-5]
MALGDIRKYQQDAENRQKEKMAAAVTAQSQAIAENARKTREAYSLLLSDDVLEKLINALIDRGSRNQAHVLVDGSSFRIVTLPPGTRWNERNDLANLKPDNAPGITIDVVTFPNRPAKGQLRTDDLNLRVRELKQRGIKINDHLIEPTGPLVIEIDWSKLE